MWPVVGNNQLVAFANIENVILADVIASLGHKLVKKEQLSCEISNLHLNQVVHNVTQQTREVKPNTERAQATKCSIKLMQRA